MFSACLVFEDLVCLFQLRPGLIALTALIALAQGFALGAECLSRVSTRLTQLTKMFHVPPLTPLG